MLRSRNRVASWFAASFALTLCGVAGRSRVGGARHARGAGVINSVTAALASSLLAALAVAEQMRMETRSAAKPRKSWSMPTRRCRSACSRSTCTATS
jgi:hypothetical protein